MKAAYASGQKSLGPSETDDMEFGTKLELSERWNSGPSEKEEMEGGVE